MQEGVRLGTGVCSGGMGMGRQLSAMPQVNGDHTSRVLASCLCECCRVIGQAVAAGGRLVHSGRCWVTCIHWQRAHEGEGALTHMVWAQGLAVVVVMLMGEVGRGGLRNITSKAKGGALWPRGGGGAGARVTWTRDVPGTLALGRW